MNSRPFEIQVYATDAGKEPFNEWLNGLDTKGRAIVRGRIERIRHGLLGDCKSVGDGVFELRVNFGPGYRVYFGMEHQQLILLLTGGDKSSQRRDILKAKAYWSEWEAI